MVSFVKLMGNDEFSNPLNVRVSNSKDLLNWLHDGYIPPAREALCVITDEGAVDCKSNTRLPNF